MASTVLNLIKYEQLLVRLDCSRFRDGSNRGGNFKGDPTPKGIEAARIRNVQHGLGRRPDSSGDDRRRTRRNRITRGKF